MKLGRNWLCWTGITALARSWEFYRNFFTYMLLGLRFASEMNSCGTWKAERKWKPTLWLGQSDTKMLKRLVCPSFSLPLHTHHILLPAHCADQLRLQAGYSTSSLVRLRLPQSCHVTLLTHLLRQTDMWGFSGFPASSNLSTSANASSRKA